MLKKKFTFAISLFWISGLLLLSTPAPAFAENDSKIKDSEIKAENKNISSEIMISKSEEKAIIALQRIIKKNKGTPQEADLHNRLAELYMRRSKSGRFFELQRDNSKVQKAMTNLPVVPSTGKEYIKKAITIYDMILKSFPNYPLTDEVIFNNAFAHQQTDQTEKSLALYQSLIQRFPQSRYIPEAYMGRGEIYYNSGNFQASLKELLHLEKYKQSKVYLYGIYKSAWAYYNLRDSENAVGQLIQVLKNETEKYSLRKETMKDLVLFTSDFYKVDEIYPFFKKHALRDEIDEVILDFASLYTSHSRYKELNSLMKDYLKDHPLSKIAVRLEIFFADNFENMKSRKEAITHVERAGQYCMPGSDWAKKNDQETFHESCYSRLKSFQAELIIKWWEIWEKNKSHPDFNQLMIGLLKAGVINENLSEKDKKTRYLLAEILFHNKNFLEASEQYQRVSDTSTDPKLRHDSSYSALFAYEKYLDTKPSVSKKDAQAKVYVLSEQYIKLNPQGEHTENVQLKLAAIFMERSDFSESEKYLKTLLHAKNKDIRMKAEDIQLEIYNIQKDFAKLKSFSDKLNLSEKDQSRKKSFQKISKEAEFNDIVVNDPQDQKLLSYALANKNTELGQQALWQILTKAFKDQRDYDAMKYAEDYLATYPKDKEVEKVTQELSAIYLDYGFFEKAAKLMSKADNPAEIEKMGDYLQMENQWKKAFDKYSLALQKHAQNSPEALRLFEKIQFSAQKDSSIKIDALIQQFVRQGVEPLATRHAIKAAQNLFDEKKYAAAFEAARKINSRSVSSEEKFPSRIIQAQVLENEFTSQSIKASIDRLSLVLAIKTEKFDKAFTSYHDALKMTKLPERQMLALSGINRSFDHFIQSLENIVLPSELTPAEQAELKKELMQLVTPLQERKEENQEKIAEIEKQSSGLQISSSLGVIQELNAKKDWTLLQATNSKMDSFKITEARKKSWKTEELLADLNQPGLKSWNLYRLASIALSEKQYEKASYLLQNVQDKDNDFVTYLSGLVFAQREFFSESIREFEKLFNKKYEVDELRVLSAFKSYASGDFLSTQQNLEKLKKYRLQSLHLWNVYVDSLVRSGQTEKAVSFLQQALKNEAVKTEKNASMKNLMQEKLSTLESKRVISSEK